MIAVFRKALSGVPATFLAAGILLASGCATPGDAGKSPDVPSVRQVTQSPHCGLTGPGLVYVRTADRLQQLLNLPAQNMAVQQLREVDLEQEHLLFVTLGEKTTGGYSVSLESAGQRQGALNLAMTVRSPASGTMVTQALTSPCVVVAFPARSWSGIRVTGVGEEDLRIML